MTMGWFCNDLEELAIGFGWEGWYGLGMRLVCNATGSAFNPDRYGRFRGSNDDFTFGQVDTGEDCLDGDLLRDVRLVSRHAFS